MYKYILYTHTYIYMYTYTILHIYVHIYVYTMNYHAISYHTHRILTLIVLGPRKAVEVASLHEVGKLCQPKFHRARPWKLWWLGLSAEFEERRTTGQETSRSEAINWDIR